MKKAKPLQEVTAVLERGESLAERKIEEDDETSRQSGQSKAPAPIFNMEDILANRESNRYSELS